MGYRGMGYKGIEVWENGGVVVWENGGMELWGDGVWRYGRMGVCEVDVCVGIELEEWEYVNMDL